MSKDQINPSHYKSVAIECIDAMRAAMGDDAVLDFCRGNALKYLWRMGKKDGNTAEMDAAKAQWYITSIWSYQRIKRNRTTIKGTKQWEREPIKPS